MPPCKETRRLQPGNECREDRLQVRGMVLNAADYLAEAMTEC